ncbi:MAG: 3'-5' exonuclease [Pirellulales bacterium]|nr:3'-5' exonuclease [Pirellulales bacterium]
MSEATIRLRRRKEAKACLAEITNNRDAVIIVHYSCQSFYNRPDGASPRITSIAVRDFASGQTISFSIHQVAECHHLSPDKITLQYDELEKEMLKEFYEYVEKHKNQKWVHWNMRDINYGFPALKHRFIVLGGKPSEIHGSQLFDLARILIDLYGVGYIGHPRLTNLIKLNSIGNLDLLPGEEEAKAFDNGEYVKLHQSTLRKVDILTNIVDRTADGTLKTLARKREIYGSNFAYAMEKIKEQWLFTLLGLVVVIGTIIQWISSWSSRE